MLVTQARYVAPGISGVSKSRVNMNWVDVFRNSKPYLVAICDLPCVFAKTKAWRMRQHSPGKAICEPGS